MPCDAICSSHAKHQFRGHRQKPNVILKKTRFYFVVHQ
jgi:hypothetical protein